MDRLSEVERGIRETEDAELTDLAADISLAEQMLEAAQRRYNDRQKEIEERRQFLPTKKSLKRTNEISNNGNTVAVRDKSPVSKFRRTTVCEDNIDGDDGDDNEDDKDDESADAIEDASLVSKVCQAATNHDNDDNGDDEVDEKYKTETDFVVDASLQEFSGPVVRRVVEGLETTNCANSFEESSTPENPPGSLMNVKVEPDVVELLQSVDTTVNNQNADTKPPEQQYRSSGIFYEVEVTRFTGCQLFSCGTDHVNILRLNKSYIDYAGIILKYS